MSEQMPERIWADGVRGYWYANQELFEEEPERTEYIRADLAPKVDVEALESIAKELDEAAKDWEACGCCSWPPRDRERIEAFLRILNAHLGGER